METTKCFIGIGDDTSGDKNKAVQNLLVSGFFFNSFKGEIIKQILALVDLEQSVYS